jgi:ABC-type lipoprotein release transport system permease subunit
MRTWIEKQRNIIDFTLSSLARRKGKNVALLLVYSLLVFLLASVMFFTHALRKEASLVLQGAPEMVVQRMAAGRHELIPHRYLDAIRSIRGVSGVHGRLWGYYFDGVTSANYTLVVPEEAAPAPGHIAIGQGISRSRLATTGDMISFRRYDGTPDALIVQDVLSARSELVSSDLILISEQDFRKLFGMQDGLSTDIVLNVRNAKEVPTVAAKVQKLLPDTRPIMRSEILRTYDTIFDWRSGIIVVILSAAVLAFVIFAWDKASGLSAEERKEIGILKAIGWETSDVLLMKFWEGTVISLSSFLTGVLLAYVHVFFTPVVLFEPVLKGWSTLYPEFRLIPFIDPYQVATLFFLTVVPYTVATIVPSWRAATIDPDSVMRS